MSTQLIPFFFKSESSHKVRAYIDESGDHWFVAKDVCVALCYSESAVGQLANLIKHVPDEWKGIKPINTPGGNQRMATLSEQGLYFFLARSDKPKALPFQKWIAGEVLPALRKTGQYSVPSSHKEAQPAETSSVFPPSIPNLPAYDRKSVNEDRLRYLRDPLTEWCRALTGGQSREDMSFLEAVTARAACRPSFSSIPLAALPAVRNWLLERVEEAKSGKGVAPVLPRIPLRKIDDIKNELLILEAAIEGADMGEPELQDAMSVKVLEVIKQVEALGA